MKCCCPRPCLTHAQVHIGPTYTACSGSVWCKYSCCGQSIRSTVMLRHITLLSVAFRAPREIRVQTSCHQNHLNPTGMSLMYWGWAASGAVHVRCVYLDISQRALLWAPPKCSLTAITGRGPEAHRGFHWGSRCRPGCQLQQCGTDQQTAQAVATPAQV